MESLVKCENISYIANQHTIINKISLDIKKNDVITIIGPNGGGKTSLIKLLLGLIQPTSGKILRSKIKIGYMPQKIEFNHQLPMSVQEFLELSKIDNLKEYHSTITNTDIEYLLNRQIHNISGGELQRVLLAKALLRNPALLILDEPLQGLDVKGQEDFYKLLETIRKEKKLTIVMVSHDLYTVMRSSNHVICLNHHICCQGKPSELSNKSYHELFGIGIDGVVASYQHHHDHDHKHGDCSHDT